MGTGIAAFLAIMRLKELLNPSHLEREISRVARSC